MRPRLAATPFVLEFFTHHYPGILAVRQRKPAIKMLIKKLLKKHKYPPEGMDDALQTVMAQCELWTDNVMDVDPEQEPHKDIKYDHFVDTDADLPRAVED